MAPKKEKPAKTSTLLFSFALILFLTVGVELMIGKSFGYSPRIKRGTFSRKHRVRSERSVIVSKEDNKHAFYVNVGNKFALGVLFSISGGVVFLWSLRNSNPKQSKKQKSVNKLKEQYGIIDDTDDYVDGLLK